MRKIRIVIGLIKMVLISLFSGGNIKYVFPVRLNPNATLSRRRGGKIIFGKHVSINTNAHLYVTENAVLSLGDNTGVGDNDVIVARDSIKIGKNVMIGPNVCIYDHDHNFKETGIMRDLGYSTAPVVIKDNVWIGAGVVILKGVTIGSGSVIAAGTVINKDVPANTIAYNKRELVMKPRF